MAHRRTAIRLDRHRHDGDPRVHERTSASDPPDLSVSAADRADRLASDGWDSVDARQSPGTAPGGVAADRGVAAPLRCAVASPAARPDADACGGPCVELALVDRAAFEKPVPAVQPRDSV